ncbi:MAG: thioredoxin family protein [Candidatus Atabeyarchaeum deiterrae]
MSVNTAEFMELEKEVSSSGKSFRELLAPELGKVYIVAITRDGCPACARQKPRFDNLASDMLRKHRNKLVFVRIHVNRLPDSEDESLRSKNLLGHYFYPTNLILIRTKDRGAIECYRNIATRMTELRNNVEALIETATAMAKDMG